MDKKFIIKLSLKNLWARKTRSLLTLVGIVVSFAAIVFLMALAFGLERLVTSEVTKGDAFVNIDVGNGGSRIVVLDDSTLASIKNISGVKNVYSVVSVGAVSSRDDRTMDVSVFGTSAGYLEMSGVNIAKGAALSGSGDGIVVNTAFLKFWSGGSSNVIGQKVNIDIVIPQGVINADSSKTIEDQQLKIIGVINDDAAPKVYVNYDSLRSYGVTSYDQFKVEVIDKGYVNEVRSKVENLGLKTQYVGDTISEISRVFIVVKTVFVLFGSIALLVALLGMMNMLTLSLLERIKEVAMMKMLGIRKRDLKTIFLAESAIIGLSGGALGLVLGALASKAANLALNHYAQLADSVSLFYIPTWFALGILLISALMGFMTGLYPARKAVKVKSLEALRYE